MPLLLRGEVFFRLSNIQYEDVGGGRMPSPAFVGHLRELTTRPATPVGPSADPAVLSYHISLSPTFAHDGQSDVVTTRSQTSLSMSTTLG